VLHCPCPSLEDQASHCQIPIVRSQDRISARVYMSSGRVYMSSGKSGAIPNPETEVQTNCSIFILFFLLFGLKSGTYIAEDVHRSFHYLLEKKREVEE
jgi:hypothetical protein